MIKIKKEKIESLVSRSRDIERMCNVLQMAGINLQHESIAALYSTWSEEYYAAGWLTINECTNEQLLARLRVVIKDVDPDTMAAARIAAESGGVASDCGPDIARVLLQRRATSRRRWFFSLRMSPDCDPCWWHDSGRFRHNQIVSVNHWRDREIDCRGMQLIALRFNLSIGWRLKE